MAKFATSVIYTVRHNGGLVGTYRATTPKAAIDRAYNDHVAAASQRYGAVRLVLRKENMTAAVEDV
jgi:hypothetical protein